MDELWCPNCGERWMYLLEESLVLIGAEGQITDWHGDVQCSTCAAVWTPAQMHAGPRLKLVQ